MELTGMELPNEMPVKERRSVDCVLRQPGSRSRIIEVDESQHFNCYRAMTLRRYPSDAKVAFDPKLWIEQSEKKSKLEGGGWGKPKPPLFPAQWGRHQQRAFRDTLCDILPPDHGFLPTLRIADFEVVDWLKVVDAGEKMRNLLDRKLQN